MVMTSDQISALTGGGQMQAMVGMQHAAMISQQAGGPYAPKMTAGEQLMGRGVNLGSAMSPILSAGTSLLGLDPISLAARGAFGGFGGGALGAGVGLGLGAVGGGALMAAQYAGQQALVGMQQQQRLNSALRANYAFQGQTQRGFTPGEMGDIGQMMRQMTMQRGPGGEFTSMTELSNLAARMSQMGMARGVRDAREFTERFRQMMDTVKEVATAFNTNLEQAQQMMGAMRASGIFRQQGAVARDIRSWARAGGLATEEVSQAMQMGSQFSRMLGGTGVAGAVGGMRTIGQIGVMQQMGALSDEALFNLTGQTGAAGRQALAQQQMGAAARFLQGGLGRRFIASMAGAGGALEEESAEEWEAGGVGTGQTMGMAHRNLARVGRAGFLRNEGRLRGQALARFGGLAPVAAMSSWLEQRGGDVSDDRSLIFMSRRLGIPIEEVEQQLKQLRMRDVIEGQRAGMQEDASMWRRVEQQRGGMGLRGVKKTLEGFKQNVQGRIQQWGAELYTEGSNVLERWINEITGNFVRSIDRDVGTAIRDVLTGTGAYAREVAETRFGMGRGLRGQQFAEASRMRAMQEAPGGYQQLGALGAARAAGDIRRLRGAGWTTAAGAGTDLEYTRAIRDVRGLQGAYATGAGFRGLDAATREALLTRTAMGGMEGGGGTPETAERTLLGLGGGPLGLLAQQGLRREGVAAGRGEATIDRFREMLGGVQTEQAQALSRRLQATSGRGRFGLMGDISREAGLGFDWRVQMPGLAGVPGGGFRTAADRDEAIGRYMLGEEGIGAAGAERAQTVRGGVGLAVGALGGAMANRDVASVMLGPAGWLARPPDVAGMVGRGVEARYRANAGGMSTDVMRAAGNFMFSEKGRQAAMGVLSRNDATAEATYRVVRERNIALLEKGQGLGGMTDLEKGEFEANKSMMMARDYFKLVEDTAKEGGPTEQQKTDLLTKQGIEGLTWGNLENRSRSVLGAAAESQQQARQQLLLRARERGEAGLAGFRGAGLMRGGVLTRPARMKFQAIGGGRPGERVSVQGVRGESGWSAGQAYLQAITGAATEQAAGNIETAMGFQEAAGAALGMMTPQQMKETERELRGTGPAGEAARGQIRGVREITRTLQRGGGQGARGLASVGQVLGLGRGELDLGDLAKRSPEEAARIMTQQLGVGRGMGRGFGAGEGAIEEAVAGGFQKDLQKALELQKAGKSPQAAVELEKLRGSGALQAAAIEKQDEAAKQQDPSYRMLSQIKEALEPLKKLADSEGRPRKVEFAQPIQVEDMSKDKGEEGT